MCHSLVTLDCCFGLHGAVVYVKTSDGRGLHPIYPALHKTEIVDLEFLLTPYLKDHGT